MTSKIKKSFTNRRGITYDNIRNIHFKKYKDLSKGLGKIICETKRDLSYFDDVDNYLRNGVFIYKPKYDSNKVLRVYKDIFGVCDDYKYTDYSDDYVVSKLQSKQKNVKLTEFPTGIVTLDKYVIGQEIPFYTNHSPLSEKTNKSDIIKYYLDILNILKELLNNDIIYSDIHADNFLIDNVNNIVRLIDFDEYYLSFDGSKTLYEDMLMNLKIMINKKSEKCSIPIKLKEENSIDEIRQTILSKKL